MAKGTHKTKDGRTVKKGLYYYMNKRKELDKKKFLIFMTENGEIKRKPMHLKI